MRKIALRVVYAALILAPLVALADYTMPPSVTFRGFSCALVQCPVAVLVDSAGNEKATVGNPVKVDPTGTTAQPVTNAAALAALNSLISIAQTNAGFLPFPIGATPVQASAVGTTAATTATLAAVAGKTTYICWLSIRANATAAATGPATITGPTPTLNLLQWTAPATSGLGINEQLFSPCMPASAINTAISAVSAAPGVGGNVTVSLGGYQL